MKQGSDIEKIRNHIKNNYLDLDKHKGYICPICGNGAGESGTGISEPPNNPDYYKCFKCGHYGDVISFYAESIGIENNEAIKQMANNLNNKTYVKNNELGVNFDVLHDNLLNTPEAIDYMIKRGIRKDTIIKYKLGYDLKDSAIVIPYIDSGKNYSIKRYIKDKNKRYKKQSGAEPIYNGGILLNRNVDVTEIFITEGQIDALTLLQAGYNAVSLGGVGHQKLLNQLKDLKDCPYIILALDNDDVGLKTTHQIARGLNDLGLTDFISMQLPKGIKDPNELYCSSTEDFNVWVNEAINKVAEHKQQKIEQYEKNSVYEDLLKYIENFDAFEPDPISTGFEPLDELLNGGLSEGLYIMGGTSGIGKTIIMSQLAFNIAKQGHNVIFCSIEMSKQSMVNRIFSHLTYEGDNKKELAFTANQIRFKGRDPKRRGMNSQEQKEWELNQEKRNKICKDKINQYSNIYKDELKRIKIIDSSMGEGLYLKIEDIEKEVETSLKLYKKPPVLLIDYLQIVEIGNKAKTAKDERQKINDVLIRFKALISKYKLPIFSISSLNRAGYNDPVNLSSYKESGGIEYTADVCLGIQPDYLYRQLENEGKKKKEAEEEINELKSLFEDSQKKGNQVSVVISILKNRHGTKGYIEGELSQPYNTLSFYKTEVPEGIEEISRKPSELKKLSRYLG